MAESSSFGFWGITSEEILKTQFPLHRACRDGEVETLSLLLVEAQHGIYVEDSFYGWTPAHWAAYFGKLNCLMRLFRSHANCDLYTPQLLQTPLHIAAFAGQPHCLKWLLHCGSSIDKQDYLGETAAHKAARTGSLECATLLAAHGARLYICNKSGHSPAQLAANCGFEECARYLEAACKRQQNEPRGVYQNQTVNGPLQTSPHDITTVNTMTACGDGLHVNGAAGVHSQSNGASEECAMEEEAGNHDSTCGDGTASHHVNPAHISSSALVGGGDADITLHSGVSASQLTVGGRKRGREDAEESNFKRMRTHGNGMDFHPPNRFISHQSYTDPTDTMHCGLPTENNNHSGQHDLHLYRATSPHVNGHHHSPGEASTGNSFLSIFPPSLQPTVSQQHDPVSVPVESSQSCLEHLAIVMTEQGYDSMLYDSMVGSVHGQ